MKETKNIQEAMANIMKDAVAIVKDRNSTQGYKFRGIDDVYNSLHQVLADNDVFMTSKVLSYRQEERNTKHGNLMLWAYVDMEFTFHHKSGTSITTQTIGEANDTSDKSTNKAMSVAQKYALLQCLLIPTEEDKDPENSNNVPGPMTQSQEEKPKGNSGETPKQQVADPVKRDFERIPEMYKKLALNVFKGYKSIVEKTYIVNEQDWVVINKLVDDMKREQDAAEEEEKKKSLPVLKSTKPEFQECVNMLVSGEETMDTLKTKWMIVEPVEKKLNDFVKKANSIGGAKKDE